MTGPGGGEAGRGAPDAARGTPEERLRALESAAPGSTGMAEPHRTPTTADTPHAPDALTGLPAPELPPHVLAGIDRALAAERAHAPGTPASAGPVPRGRSVLVGVAALVLLVALAAVAVGTGGVRSGSGTTPAGPVTAALPPGSGTAPSPSAPVLGRAELPSALRAALGATDAGPLADPARLTACLRAQPEPSPFPPVGRRRVVLDGVPGVLLVLPTGVAARFRLLVVGEDCGAGRPATLADTVVGR